MSTGIGKLGNNFLEFVESTESGGGTSSKLVATSQGLITFTSENDNDVELKGVTIPTDSNSVANKQYVDNLINGLSWKNSVRLASDNANYDLNNIQADNTKIDGVTLVTNDRILLKNQSDESQNGIYVVAADNTAVRSDDLPDGSNARSIAMLVQEGVVNKDSGWVCTNDAGSDVVDTNNLNFVKFSATVSGISGGEGIDINGGEIAVDNTVVRTNKAQLIGDKKTFTDTNNDEQGTGIVMNDSVQLVIGSVNQTVIVRDEDDVKTSITTSDAFEIATTDRNNVTINLGSPGGFFEVGLVEKTPFTVDGAGTVIINNVTTANENVGALTVEGGISVKQNIYVSGDVTALSNVTVSGDVTASSHISVSDERKKKDIKPLENTSDIVNKLNPVSYKWKDEKIKETKYGLIAQEVRKVLPDSVYEDGEGSLSIDYNCVWAMLLKSHQELVEVNKKLSERVSALEAVKQ